MKLLPATCRLGSGASPRPYSKRRVCNALWLRSFLFVACLGMPLAFGQNSSAANEGLSKEFTQSAISAMVSIHQVKDNIATVVAKNLPNGYYDPSLAAQAYEKLRIAETSTSTYGDQQTATLLTSYFTKVKNWAEKYKADRQSLNATRTMSHDVLGQDSDWHSIDACEKALNRLLTDRTYIPVRSCQ